MSITKAIRMLSPADREQAKELMAELVENDGLTREQAAEEALMMMRDESESERESLIKRIKK